ncbi:glycosyltransferase family 2 protein [Flavobacterium undicola]|uniref:glycosyltransferase family 2 protein n=1 Tax=Flavobacterium undicola TaxID=1932779 RepID=UPI001376FFDD|nr:glycosyltransferase [Flavobacterium undicola]MBA0884752.1 glycosyltransferase [Flavobacterium undicola]
MLAIIIPYYKLAFFAQTLLSLANQKDKRFKVYIGDDASPEDCSSLLDDFEGKLDFVYHRFDNNLGGTSLTEQWERCIALSGDEEWLMILGDDDLLGENVVEEFYKKYTVFEEKSNVVRYASVIINGSGKMISKKFENQIWENPFDSYFRKFEGLSRSSLSEHIFSRKVYLKYGFVDYPLAWFSDDNAWFDFSEQKFIFSINEANVYIRNSDINISGMVDNISQKKKATIIFYENILNSRLKFFSKERRLKMIYRYEIELRSERKLTFIKWNSLMFLYVKNYDSYTFKNFFKRSIKNIINL